MNPFQIISYEGRLAVTRGWRPDYDRPVMSRIVWASKHPIDPRWTDWTVTDGPCDGEWQHWELVSPMGGRIAFKTPKHGVVEEGEEIRQPRKRGHWQWHAGEWVKSPYVVPY